MNNYEGYTADDFASDPYFAEWILDNAASASEFWIQWLKDNPERADQISEARILVLSVHQTFGQQLTEEEIQDDVQKIVQRVENYASFKKPVRSLWPNQFFFWRAIAAAAFILGIGLYFYKKSRFELFSPELVTVENDMLRRINNSSHPMTVLLNDGSVVNLEPGSELYFPLNFQKELRRVYLKGEAFFDIAKNPARPFLVVTRKGITKVVGTSFRVRANQNEMNESVIVRTGKVSVYVRESFEKFQKQKDTKVIGVQLLPNQQAELNSIKGTLQKTTVTNPELIAVTQVGPSEITFDNQPVAEVLHTISKLYEVNIVFNSDDFSGCRITSTFGDETLPERLNSICQAIGATYHIFNDKIEFSGKGCPAQPANKF